MTRVQLSRLKPGDIVVVRTSKIEAVVKHWPGRTGVVLDIQGVEKRYHHKNLIYKDTSPTWDLEEEE